jgi:hypothetical protein
MVVGNLKAGIPATFNARVGERINPDAIRLSDSNLAGECGLPSLLSPVRIRPRASKVIELMKKISVQPEWCLELPIQQQSVLFLAARGPDGIAKAHPCKDIQRAYRASVLIAAKRGRLLKWGESADSFMSLDLFADDELWHRAVANFFQTADDLPHHFYMHLMHGAEILGYKHPDKRFRDRWLNFYLQCVNELHLASEGPNEMDDRLSDWNREHWEDAASCVKCGTALTDDDCEVCYRCKNNISSVSGVGIMTHAKV